MALRLFALICLVFLRPVVAAPSEEFLGSGFEVVLEDPNKKDLVRVPTREVLTGTLTSVTFEGSLQATLQKAGLLLDGETMEALHRLNPAVNFSKLPQQGSFFIPTIARDDALQAKLRAGYLIGFTFARELRETVIGQALRVETNAARALTEVAGGPGTNA